MASAVVPTHPIVLGWERLPLSNQLAAIWPILSRLREAPATIPVTSAQVSLQEKKWTAHALYYLAMSARGGVRSVNPAMKTVGLFVMKGRDCRANATFRICRHSKQPDVRAARELRVTVYEISVFGRSSSARNVCTCTKRK
jgi:hypothetical protein